MKTKAFDLDVKALTEEGTFEGYASTFGGKPDSYGDVVERGAFTESLAQHEKDGTRPLMFWQHDPHEPIGVWDSLAEDRKGLKVKGRLLKGVRRAEEALILLREGAIRGLSIGYREILVKPADPDAREPRRLMQLDLIEASIVSLAANQRAQVEAVKNQNWDRLEDFMRALRDKQPRPISEFEGLLRDAGAPKSMAVAIASRGYAHAIRSESEGKTQEAVDAAADALASLRSIFPQ